MRLFALLFAVFVTIASAAPLLHSDSPKAINGQYIVVFYDGAPEAARQAHLDKLTAKASARNDTVLNTYALERFSGYSARLSKDSLAEILADDLIQFVEADQVVTLNDVETGATWGLDRVDQTSLPLDKKFNYFTAAGAGVNAYVIDTGIYTDHNEFDGRAIWGENFADSEDTDCNGHGTHVAGTIAGTVFGVAKKANVYAVKVLTCSGSGTNAGVISGVQWAANHYKKSKKNGVANMSLGGGVSTALDKAIQAAITTGLTFAIAAGNENSDACQTSPARVSSAITVGATTKTDTRASFSNYGTCLDVFAPGQEITAAWIGDIDATNTISGTSMATPHVAGVIALHLGEQDEIITDADEIHSWVTETATPDKIKDPVGSPNLLLYSPYK